MDCLHFCSSFYRFLLRMKIDFNLDSYFKLSNKAKVFGVNVQEFEHYDNNISFSWSPSETYIPLELEDCDGFYSFAA